MYYKCYICGNHVEFGKECSETEIHKILIEQNSAYQKVMEKFKKTYRGKSFMEASSTMPIDCPLMPFIDGELSQSRLDENKKRMERCVGVENEN